MAITLPLDVDDELDHVLEALDQTAQDGRVDALLENHHVRQVLAHGVRSRRLRSSASAFTAAWRYMSESVG